MSARLDIRGEALNWSNPFARCQTGSSSRSIRCGVICTAATAAYAKQRRKNANMMRVWATPNGVLAPKSAPVDSTIVQTDTHIRSTDPKKNGARINALIVSQSWIALNVSIGAFKCSRDAIETLSLSYHLVFVAVFTFVTAFAVFDAVLAVLLMSVSNL